jgi:transposase InsO family protein
MKGKVGTSTSIYHTRLPHQRKIFRMARTVDLSKEAKVRLSWLGHYKKHANASTTCRRFGISRSTLYKWAGRYIERGPLGLEDLSRAPKRRRTSAIPWQTTDLIVAIRSAQPAWSKHKIAVILARDHGIRLSASTVGRILKRKGLYDERVSRKRRQAARRRKQRLRSERWMKEAFPGCLVQIDTKYLIFEGNRFYQFTAVDCFSRVAFCRVYSSAGSKCAEAFLAELLGYMPFSILALQTDNGSEFLRHFDQATEDELITHYFSHPYCPKDNAHVERKIQTTKYELWAFKRAYTAKDLNELLDEWNHTYNYVRPHQSLGYLTPMEFLAKWSEESGDRDHVSAM